MQLVHEPLRFWQGCLYFSLFSDIIINSLRFISSSSKISNFIKFESILKYLSYNLFLFESEVFDAVIVVQSLILSYSTQQMISKQFQAKLQLAISLFLTEIDYNNFNIYRKLIDNFLNGSTIIKYIKFMQYVHKEKKDFLNRLEQLKLFDRIELLQIQNSKKIQQKQINQNQKVILIKNRNKRKLSELFTEYKNTKTPGQLNQQQKKQWDDDLKGTEIKISNKETLNQPNEPNILELLEDSVVENAQLDVDILMDLDEN